MGRVVPPGGLITRGNNRVIDAAGWQRQTPDTEESGRSRRITGFTHHRRVKGRIHVAALCPGYY